jgi:hypothetical protein
VAVVHSKVLTKFKRSRRTVKLEVNSADFWGAFRAAWRHVYSEQNRREIDRKYSMGGAGWTRIMVGDGELPPYLGKSLVADTVRRMAEKMGIDLTPDPERHKFDMLIRIRRNGQSRDEHFGFLNVGVVEVENDVDTAIEEMWKLVHFRAPLKVLITYDYCDQSTRNRSLFEFDRLRKDAVDVFGEDGSSYLIIFGGRKDDDREKEIEWRAFELRANSAIVPLP